MPKPSSQEAKTSATAEMRSASTGEGGGGDVVSRARRFLLGEARLARETRGGGGLELLRKGYKNRKVYRR